MSALMWIGEWRWLVAIGGPIVGTVPVIALLAWLGERQGKRAQRRNDSAHHVRCWGTATANTRK